MAGVVILAPVAARSATQIPADMAERLLPVADAPVMLVDRGSLSGRQGTLAMGVISTSGQSAETLEADAMSTPVIAPMEATIVPIATPAPPAPPPPPQRVVTYNGSTVWDDLAKCESGGNWAINTGNGYYGGLQFNLGTWQDYGGAAYAAYPHEATREEQIAVAERLHAARGYAPWPACRAKLGLP